MPTSEYTTAQGQAWDQIALSELGSEAAMRDLILANFQARGVLLFSGEKKLEVPELDESRVCLEALPPWQRAGRGE